METATVFVVALPDDEAAMKTVESARALNASCKIVVRCRYQANVRAFKKLGAMLVVSEEVQAGDAILREMQKWEQPNALAP